MGGGTSSATLEIPSKTMTRLTMLKRSTRPTRSSNSASLRVSSPGSSPSLRTLRLLNHLTLTQQAPRCRYSGRMTSNGSMESSSAPRCGRAPMARARSHVVNFRSSTTMATYSRTPYTTPRCAPLCSTSPLPSWRTSHPMWLPMDLPLATCRALPLARHPIRPRHGQIRHGHTQVARQCRNRLTHPSPRATLVRLIQSRAIRSQSHRLVVHRHQ